MRVTSQYLLNNFRSDQQKVNQELKKVTEQISSGKKIQQSHEDPGIYDDTLRLDSQINDLQDVQKRMGKAKNFTTATDDALQDFTDSLRTFKSKVIAAVNDAVNSDNREAIAKELEEEKAHMMRLANTQIGGEYLFSGSATSVKPIDENGHYQGNDRKIETIVGEGVRTAYNIDGVSLFLGSKESVHKTVSTNVALKNSQTGAVLNGSDTLKELTGSDAAVNFKLSGTGHDGSALKEEFTIESDETLDTLLEKIGSAYGNSSTSKRVKVELNDVGNIVVTDLKNGKSQLEMKLHGSFDDGSGTAKELSFIKSDFTYADAGNDDSAFFVKKGSLLKGNVTLMADGKLADNTTKLRDIANGTMDGKAFIMNLTDINGDSYRVNLNLDDDSTFTVRDSAGNNTTYSIYNADGTQTKADEMTMGQLNNIVSIVTSGELPAAGSADAFNDAVIRARDKVDVSVNQSGKMEILDKSNDLSKISFSIYDNKATDFSDTAPTISFNANNAVTTQKAEMDFFAQLDDVIDAVRQGRTSLVSEGGNPRNIGMESAIQQLDQFDSHFNTQLARIGAIEKSLTHTQDRAMTMEVSLKSLKSDLTDVDLAEAYMNLNEISMSYQAILSTVTKINSLTLLNYMK
ncbi:MAG: flagellar hook-associated protein 3 [Sulfurospirillum sp.]|nr:MAG: flagellar hook-associated protein 3 [Sulfurospirillum sp.]